MLGRDVTDIAKKQNHEVIDFDIRDENKSDITNLEYVLQVCEKFKPHYILHLAAFTDVDECERSPDKAYLINTIGTSNMVHACLKYNTPLIYISTGCVFNGLKCTPYTEFDSPDPRSVYANSKYQGELLISAHLQKYTILRAGWLFGGKGEDKKFVAKILDLALKTKELKVVNDKFGSPTYTKDFAKGIMFFIENELYGLYHLVNKGFASRYEIARKIFQFARVPNIAIDPVSSAHFPLSAPRPRIEALEAYKLDIMNKNPMRNWEHGLKEYIDEIIKDKSYTTLFE